MDERRQLPRWEIKKKAKVWMPLSQDPGQCIVEDMHLKGMCVSFDKRLPKEDVVKMSFALDGNLDSITIEAQIPWAKEDDGRFVYGLSFTKIADDDKERMYKYISTTCYDQFRKNWWA